MITFYYFLLEGVLLLQECQFQSSLIHDLKRLFPGCIVLKNDCNYVQGFPDLIVLYQNKWAVLECKQQGKAKRRPNQEHYVRVLNTMSFSRFIYPENKEEVLCELQQTFCP